MNPVRIMAIALIVAGVLGLVYGGFSYTRETHEARIGPVEFSVTDRERVNVPVWVGAGAVFLGGVLLLLGRKKG
jgi:hypothetical protein